MKITLSKKIFSLLLAVLLCLPLICGCTSELTPSEDPSSVTAEDPSLVTTTEETHIPDPAADDVMRILMIGNSFSYYYVEELYGMAEAAGIKMQVCNLYYSGCRLSSHWEWFLTNTKNYAFYVTDENGRIKKPNITTLRQAVAYEDWDVISFQDAYSSETANSYDTCYNISTPYAERLLDLLKGEHPNAKYYFHQTWARQVGYNGSNGTVPDTATQDLHQDNISRACVQVAKDLGISLIPSGEAWYAARHNPLIGDILCNKGPNGDATAGDFSHEGTTGGGQFLNACVWFEVLTGKSCVGNTYRPQDYDLWESRATLLQQIAHETVMNTNI